MLRFDANRKKVIELCSLTEIEYNEKIYDLGIAFLQSQFPEKSKYGHYYEMHTKTKMFWNWFRSEWHAYEQKMLHEYSHSDLELNAMRWHTRMNRIVFDQHVERSFAHNYINNASEVKIS